MWAIFSKKMFSSHEVGKSEITLIVKPCRIGFGPSIHFVANKIFAISGKNCPKQVTGALL